MAQGRSTKIISMMKWIRTSRLSYVGSSKNLKDLKDLKNSLSLNDVSAGEVAVKLLQVQRPQRGPPRQQRLCTYVKDASTEVCGIVRRSQRGGPQGSSACTIM